MKFLILLALIGISYQIYSSNQESKDANTNPTDARELFNNLRAGKQVSKEAIIFASIKTSEEFCNDESLQQVVGHTTSSCYERLHAFKSMCEERIFLDKKRFYSDIDKVSPLYKRFIKCVGT